MKKLPIIILSLVFLASCTNMEVNEFPESEILEFDNTFSGTLFDKGSWFGVERYMDDNSGLAPLFMLSDSNGYHLNMKLLDLHILQNGEKIPLKFSSTMFPGRIIRKAKGKGVDVYLYLSFHDHQTLAVFYQIDIGDSLATGVDVHWEYAPDGVLNDDTYHYELGNAEIAISSADNQHLGPSDKTKGFIFIRHRFKTEAAFGVPDYKQAYIRHSENINRWDFYLNSIDGLNQKDKMLASKCIQTLVSNWRSPAGELKHAGLFPSYAYGGFHGFWAWDSWKHAVALVGFEAELAKDQVRAMFDFQDEYGMIADCIFRDTLIEKHNWRDTKPPLAGWAIKRIFDETNDTAFVREMFPYLIRYHEWWYTNRDYNRNGLCEYGSTDGTRVAAAWESGMDNAVRFDSARLVRINEHAWSLTQESVDLNAYLYAEKGFLAGMAEALGDEECAIRFGKESVELKDKIQKIFYDDESGYFYDISTIDGSYIKIIGPEAWITMWAGIADSLQAASVVEKIMDTMHFNTFVPFPTLSASHPNFNPERGYWRGPVWLDQAYFALEGMRHYGYEDEYRFMKNKLLTNAEGLIGSGEAIRENYHPLSGKGLNANHFSWSAAHLMLLLKN